VLFFFARQANNKTRRAIKRRVVTLDVSVDWKNCNAHRAQRIYLLLGCSLTK